VSARATVGAVALAVTALTQASAALAEPPPAPSAEPVAASATSAAAQPAATPAPAPAATPLAVRPSRPVELAPEPRGLGLGAKLGLGALVLLGGAWVYVQTRNAKKNAPKKPSLRIAARAGIGVRSELLIVEVEGQRLLLGVTPGSVQRLAVLPDPDAVPIAAPADLKPAPASTDFEPGFLGALRAAAAQSVVRARREADERDDRDDRDDRDARDEVRERLLPTRAPLATLRDEDEDEDEEDEAPRAPAPPKRAERPARPVWRPSAETGAAPAPKGPPPARPRRIAAVVEPPASRPAAAKAEPKPRARGRAAHDDDPLPGQASLPLDVGPTGPARALPRPEEPIEEQARGLARLARGA
jgi:flagellar protein FliO/FliZ